MKCEAVPLELFFSSSNCRFYKWDFYPNDVMKANGKKGLNFVYRECQSRQAINTCRLINCTVTICSFRSFYLWQNVVVDINNYYMFVDCCQGWFHAPLNPQFRPSSRWPLRRSKTSSFVCSPLLIRGLFLKIPTLFYKTHIIFTYYLSVLLKPTNLINN